MNQIYKHEVTIINALPPISGREDKIAFDTEFFGQEISRLHRPHGEFASLACTSDGKTIYYIVDKNQIQEFLSRIDLGLLIGHNLQYDIKQLRAFVEFRDRKSVWDTLILDQIRYSGYYDRFALDDLFRRYCGMYLPKEERKSFSAKLEGMTDEQIFYAACDVVATWRIYQEQSKQIDENDLYVWENIERPMLWTLLDTGGITIDKEKWLEIAQSKENTASTIYDELAAKYNINVRSPKQLLAFLQGEGLDIENTGKAELKKHEKEHEIIPFILTYRKPAKGASTYGKKWAEEWIEEDGRVYTSYRQIGTVTGRLASANPNLQNIPIRDEPIYRECFVAGEE